MPAPKTGDLYKNTAMSRDGLVAAVPSRVFRDGTGTFGLKVSHNPLIIALARGTDWLHTFDWSEANVGKTFDSGYFRKI
jgi:hypothetical protein